MNRHSPGGGGPLAGRVAIVAGASRGRGQGIAIELGAAGAIVHLLGRTRGSDDDLSSLNGTRGQIEASGGEAVIHVGDAADSAHIASVIAKIAAAHQRLDIVVNSVFSASQFGKTIGKRAWELTDDDWVAVAEAPTRSAFLLVAHGAPLLMHTATAQQPGLIVTVSGRGAQGYRYNAVYGAGKVALARMTADLSQELALHHVAVLDVWPNGYAPDPEQPETPRYSGRAVAALASDPNLMARSGEAIWSAQVGAEFDLTDEFGHRHSIPPVTDGLSRPL